MRSFRFVVTVFAAGGLAAVAAGLSPLASGSPVVAAPAAAPAAAAPAPVISGVVRAADTRRPLSGVYVMVESPLDPADYDMFVTDSAGRYRAPGLRPGVEYTVSFFPDERSRYLHQSAPGTASRYRARRYKAPAVVNASLVAGVSISGRVTSSSGRPVRSAMTVVRPVDSAHYGQWVATDSSGRWTAKVAPGRYRVLSLYPDRTSAGYYPGGRSLARTPVITVGSRGRAGVDVKQAAPARLRVTVTAAATGRPLTSACVQRGYREQPLPSASQQGTQPADSLFDPTFALSDCSSADGVHTIGVEPGMAWAEASDRNRRYGPAATAPVRVAAGRTVDVRIALAAAGTLTGRVVDRTTGRAMAGCVTAWPVDDVGRGVDTSHCTGEDGRWRIGGLAPGNVKITVEPTKTHVKAWAPAADTAEDAALYTVRAGATTTVPPIRIARGGSISGRVLDSRGKAVAGAGVRLGGGDPMEYPRYTATTDTAGRYRMVNLPPGPHGVQVLPPSYTGLGSAWVGGAGDMSRARQVTVPSGRAVSVPDLRLRAGAKLSVVVLGPVDESIVVEALDPQGRIVGQAPATLPLRTGKAGRTITLTGLPATAVRVHAFSTRTDPIRHSWLGGVDFTTAEPIVLSAGRTSTVNIRPPAPVAMPATTAGVRGAAPSGPGSGPGLSGRCASPLDRLRAAGGRPVVTRAGRVGICTQGYPQVPALR